MMGSLDLHDRDITFMGIAGYPSGHTYPVKSIDANAFSMAT